MPELVLPTTRLHAPFLACRDEWGPGPQEDDGDVLGGIVLRHHFDDDLGQIGYGIRPSARRRGLATWALSEMLAEACVALSAAR